MKEDRYKRAAIPRAGYEYQDLVGIEVLIHHYRDPHLYSWVAVEADDPSCQSLDDVVAERRDGSYEFIQVKFTVDPGRFELDWDWLLDKSEHGDSLLGKWARAFARVAALGPIHSASLRTNRPPSAEFARSLHNGKVDLGQLPPDLRQQVEDACGDATAARAFFLTFDFTSALPDLDAYEAELQEQLVPMDTDLQGWYAFRDSVRKWAIRKNHPTPGGHILRENVAQLLTKRRPRSIRQDFAIPDGYRPPTAGFDESIRARLASVNNPITIIWGTPGCGKSTYLSYLTRELQAGGAPVIRHHYFLSAEDSSGNRISFYEISASLLDQLGASHPEAMVGADQGNGNLRTAITLAAANLAAQGQRLHIVVDGLDHVWRDSHRLHQLVHLFNELLPLPANVSLVVGTQRVPDQQLPGRLLKNAATDDWVALPRMDEVAVHDWVVQQDAARPLLLRFDPTPERRAEVIEQVAAAFFTVSQGHPLHLIYAYEWLIRSGRPTTADEVAQLPPCPNNDIREYYKGLWVRLTAQARNALHVLAETGFFWPSTGIMQVFGDVSEIEFLLEHHHAGMVPFHPSIFAWVREQEGHAEVYKALLPKVTEWLEDRAGDYWRWGWLWLARAQDGDFSGLLEGTTRDWAVASLASGWPHRQIANILSAAEAKAFADGDLPRTVSLHALKGRALSAREFQSSNFASFRATALAVSDNRQQVLNLLDELQGLTDGEVSQLACLCPAGLSSQVVPACLQELVRRVNTWIALRHRPGHEFIELGEQLIEVSALQGEEVVQRTLRFALQFSEAAPRVTKLIHHLGSAGNIAGLKFLRGELAGPRWVGHRQQIQDSLVRALSLAGADAWETVRPTDEPVSAFTACWTLWREPKAKPEVHVPSAPRDLARERYMSDEAAELAPFLYDAFWVTLCETLLGEADNESWLHSSLPQADLGWLSHALSSLEVAALQIGQRHLEPEFATIYRETMDVEPVDWGYPVERDQALYRAFKEALRLIAVDLHVLGLRAPRDQKVSSSDLSVVRQSPHWSDEVWVTRTMEDRIQLLDRDAAAGLLSHQAAALSATVSEFNERSMRWTELASVAQLYGDGRQAEFIRHAAECLVGYGWHKDLSALDVLDAIVQVGIQDPSTARSRLETVAPIIDVITDFTDGDETDHVKREFIEAVATVAPERLPALYGHYLSTDSYWYADDCLVQVARIMDLTSPEGAALARTFLDDRTLGALEERAPGEPAAQTLLQEQSEFLGRTRKPRSEAKATEDEPTDREREAAKVDPTSFESDNFTAVAEAAGAIHYTDRQAFMLRWLSFWRAKGQTSRALSSIASFFEKDEGTLDAEHILDAVFLVSLEAEGREAAYPWLVRAHTYRHGWDSLFTSSEEVIARLQLAAEHFGDQWATYIRDTSVPPRYFRRYGHSLALGSKYLVRFLTLIGQAEVAGKVTDELVASLVEEVRDQPIQKAPWFR